MLVQTRPFRKLSSTVIQPGLLHIFTFEDEAAQTRHSESDAVRRFESVYAPELVGGPVVFTDYVLVATNQQAPLPARRS